MAKTIPRFSHLPLPRGPDKSKSAEPERSLSPNSKTSRKPRQGLNVTYAIRSFRRSPRSPVCRTSRAWSPWRRRRARRGRASPRTRPWCRRSRGHTAPGPGRIRSSRGTWTGRNTLEHHKVEAEPSGGVLTGQQEQERGYGGLHFVAGSATMRRRCGTLDSFFARRSQVEVNTSALEVAFRILRTALFSWRGKCEVA